MSWSSPFPNSIRCPSNAKFSYTSKLVIDRNHPRSKVRLIDQLWQLIARNCQYFTKTGLLTLISISIPKHVIKSSATKTSFMFQIHEQARSMLIFISIILIHHLLISSLILLHYYEKSLSLLHTSQLAWFFWLTVIGNLQRSNPITYVLIYIGGYVWLISLCF